ncbi:hypothetical protein GQ602_002100 [Ophiocordyceps camponoti-floridani]|uniref:SIS domain-containing protein n=1 Tax=Ophiocordyceps camponoti-floridani TaxID=2030778 RepID=A0A8H4QA32_9HYPO|nr:hypothetical protein GQ602_002100 [Ophiocordyceps camponoti-floridani]
MAIQTSAVILLGGQKGPPAEAPPSPPTPCISPDDGSLCEPASPFSLDDDLHGGRRRGPSSPMARGLHVLTTEAAALASLARLYESDADARHGFESAVRIVARPQGKLVVVGVGKSGHVGRKLVATLQSLAIRSVFLHPTEAMHGDLGIIDPARDALLFISFSGRTQELLQLLPHLDPSIPAIVMTSQPACDLIRRRPTAVLLPAPIPEPEEKSFGVPAPTTSTTVALALCDALALTAADELHRHLPAEFARNHPGGAIGAVRPRTVDGP